MQGRNLCCPPYLFLGPAVPPSTFFILESPLIVFIWLIASFGKLKSRFKLIGISIITSYISLVLIQKTIFNLLRHIQNLL